MSKVPPPDAYDNVTAEDILTAATLANPTVDPAWGKLTRHHTPGDKINARWKDDLAAARRGYDVDALIAAAGDYLEAWADGPGRDEHQRLLAEKLRLEGQLQAHAAAQLDARAHVTRVRDELDHAVAHQEQTRRRHPGPRASLSNAAKDELLEADLLVDQLTTQLGLANGAFAHIAGDHYRRLLRQYEAVINQLRPFHVEVP